MSLAISHSRTFARLRAISLMLVAISVFIGVASSTAHAQTKYTVTEIGVGASGLSNSGLATGSVFTPDGSPTREVFSWSKSGGMVRVSPCPDPDSLVFAYGINSLGQIIGECTGDVTSTTFVWDPVTHTTVINAHNCVAWGVTGINDTGQVSGTYVDGCADQPSHALRWDGSIHLLIDSNPKTYGRGINSQGYVVGESGGRASMWGPEGLRQSLGTLGGDSVAIAINDSRQVVGYFVVGEGLTRPFIWDSTNGMRSLGVLPGASACAANSINNAGVAVGSCFFPDASANRAFIWDSQNGIRDLNDLIPQDSGWVLNDAGSINDHGQILANGLHNGTFDGCLLTSAFEPLIFIPGITGSTLRIRNDGEVWLGGAFDDKRVMTLDPLNPQADIVPGDVFRSTTILGHEVEGYQKLLNMLTTTVGYREYQINNNPARLTSAGCDLSQKTGDPSRDPTLFVFPYDWRKPNDNSAGGSAAALKDYVACVRKFYPDAKVNILAHSQGGLVARRYILSNPGAHEVKRLVTIATPWLGAPRALYILETGKFFQTGFDIQTALKDYAANKLFAPMFKSLVEFFPAMHQLLPSPWYNTLGGHSFGEVEGKQWWDINRNGVVDPVYDPIQVNELLDGQFPRSRPGQTSLTFHNFPGQDDWRADNTGVLYTQIYGRQYYNHTIVKVVAASVPQFDKDGNEVRVDDYKPLYGLGDGTVPLISAERIGASTDLNGTVVTKIFKRSTLERFNDPGVEHTGLTANPEVWNDILTALTATQVARTRVRPPSLFQNARFIRASAAPQQPPGDSGESYYFNIIGADRVVVADALGNSNAPIEGTPFDRRVPGVEVAENDVSADVIFGSELTADQSYTLTFRSTGKPIQIDMTKGQGNAPESATQIIRYLDVNLPAGTPLMLKVTALGVENLRVDADGDGSFETTIEPTAAAVGPSARDTHAPTVTFSEETQGGNRVISINAADDLTGVKIIRYSLDGRRYQVYSTPLVLNADQSTVVYVIADDNVANRSNVYSYNVNPNVLNAIGPAQVWIGLKNSDDVGTRFDLLAEVFKNGSLIGSGQVDNVNAGSSGFNNSKLNAINLAMVGSPGLAAGDALSIRLSVRVTATGGHRSGTARLWFNDNAANTRFTTSSSGATDTYYLRASSVLGTSAGPGPKSTVDVFVDRAVGGNPFKTFGTWTITF